MSRSFALVLGLVAGSVTFADDSPPKPIADLVKKLASPDFRTRDQAAKDLEAAGRAALPALRELEKSDDPELAAKAKELVERIGKQAANDATLAPTLVQLPAEERELREILADLEKQSAFHIVVSNPALYSKKLTVRTEGKVPFWKAIEKLCDVAGLEVASDGVAARTDPKLGLSPKLPVGQAPAMPAPAADPDAIGRRAGVEDALLRGLAASLRSRIQELTEFGKLLEKRQKDPLSLEDGRRIAALFAEQQSELDGLLKRLKGVQARQAEVERVLVAAATPRVMIGKEIFLQPRVGNRKPFCVSGAVLCEVVPFPTAALPTVSARELPILLQLDLEPKLEWTEISGIRISKAIDFDDRELTPVAGNGKMPVAVRPIGGGNIVVDPDGGVSLVPNPPKKGQPTPTPTAFRANSNQALARLQIPADNPAPTRLKRLEGAVRGKVWNSPTRLATLELGEKPTRIIGKNNVTLSAWIEKRDNGTHRLRATIAYTRSQVRPTHPIDDQFGEQGQAHFQTQTVVNGLSVVDEKGQTFELSGSAKLLSARLVREGRGGGFVANPEKLIDFEITLTPLQKGQGKPAELLFSGYWLQNVEVPFEIADVPVAAGLAK